MIAACSADSGADTAVFWAAMGILSAFVIAMAVVLGVVLYKTFWREVDQ